MTLESVLAKLDVMVEAPNGMQNLRNLVLQLAVSGKLVPFDAAATMRPLSYLLREDSLNGISRRPNDDATGTPILRISAGTSRDDGFVDEADYRHVDINETDTRKYALSRGDLLACRFNGSLRFVGRMSLYRGESGVAQVYPDKLIRFRVDPTKAAPRFVQLAFNAPETRKEIEALCATTAGNIGIAAGRLKHIRIPAPPLAVQAATVEKVDELMALCDEYERRSEAATKAQAVARQRIVEQCTRSEGVIALADLILSGGGTADDVLFSAAGIDDLRRLIVDLAVQGHLEPDAPIEPAVAPSSTHRAIAASGEESVPSDWTKCLLGDLAESIEAGWSPACETRPKAGDEWGVIKISAVTWNVFDPDENKALPADLEPRPALEICAGDFLMSRANTAELVGRSVVVEHTPPKLMLNDKTLRIRWRAGVDPRYLNLYNNSTAARRYYSSAASGTSSSMRNLSREQIRKLPVAVPPYAEQRRIVAEVTRLLHAVDSLEQSLRVRHELASRVSSSMMRQLTAA